MKKVTKGIVAAGLGVGLLVGGGGTLAYWTDNQTVGGGTITAGHLNIVTDATNTGCGAWTLDTGEQAPSVYSPGDKIVPGDVLSRQCAFTIKATGNHLRATLAVSAANFTGGNTNFGGDLTVAVTGTKIDGNAATEFTEADDGKTLTTAVTVTFNSASGNATKDYTTLLSDVTVTASQVHA